MDLLSLVNIVRGLLALAQWFAQRAERKDHEANGMTQAIAAAQGKADDLVKKANAARDAAESVDPDVVQESDPDLRD